MDDFERRLASRLSAYEQSVPAAHAPGTAAPTPHRVAWAPIAAVVVLAVGIGLVGSRVLSGLRPVGNAPVTSLAWTTHPFIDGARVVDLKAIGTRLIATGSTVRGDGTPPDEAAAWYSDDVGVTWAVSSVEAPSGSPAGAAHALGRVVVRDDELLALDAYTIGLASDTSSDTPSASTVTTAVWISADDGQTWDLAEPVPGPVSSISASPDGIIALGTGEGGIVVGWHSPDGETWQPLPLDGMPEEAYVADIAYDGSAFVAVGSVSVQQGDIPDERAPAAWRSIDGARWTVSQLALSGAANAISVAGSSSIAAGATGVPGEQLSATAVVWRPTGSEKWAEQRLPQSSPAQASSATGIVTNALGSLARINVGGGRGLRVAQELWFIPVAQADKAMEQGLGIQVSAMAALPDRFVVISTCGTTLATCASSVSIGTGAALAPSSASPSASPSPTPSLAESPAPSPDASPTASSEPPLSGWTAISIGETASVESVVENGPTLTAIGYGEDAMTVWTSTDAMSWTPGEPLQPDDLRTEGFTVRSLLWTGSRYVAAGFGGVDGTVPLVYTSPDRVHWERATFPDDLKCGRVNNVLRHGAELVALGYSCVESPGHALVWTSSDGQTWESAETGSADLDRAELLDAVATDDGFIAVGFINDDNGSTAGIWRSSAGKGELVATFDDATVWAIAERDGQYVAVGHHDEGEVAEPAIWTSTDGSNWTDEGVCIGCRGWIGSVVSDANGFYAFGSTGPPSSPEPVIYESSDGMSWTHGSLTGLQHGEITGVIDTMFGPLAFGYSGGGDALQVPVIVTLNR